MARVSPIERMFWSWLPILPASPVSTRRDRTTHSPISDSINRYQYILRLYSRVFRGACLEGLAESEKDFGYRAWLGNLGRYSTIWAQFHAAGSNLAVCLRAGPELLARNRRVKDARRSVTGPLSAALPRDICGQPTEIGPRAKLQHPAAAPLVQDGHNGC